MNSPSGILCFDRFRVEHTVYPPGLYMPPHKDKFSRISIILDGSLKETSGNEEVYATAGSLVIKPNYTLHENIFGDKPVRSLSVIFHDDSLLNNYFTQWRWISHPKTNVLGIRLCSQMCNERDEKKIICYLQNFFSAIAVFATDTGSKTLVWIEQLKEMIRKNLSNPEHIDSLSHKLSLHRAYLCRAFKKNCGISPVEFRKYSRISAAVLDLVLTHKPLAALAYDAGYSDQSHMNREFRQYIDCTPSHFRQLMSKS